VVTVGTFDGLHVGHQKIIQRMKQIAREQNGETILVTFHPHPRLVLNHNAYEIRFINSLKRKYELLDSFGIDQMIIIPFTREFAQTSSEDFITNILVEKIGVKKLIVGYDHHFGKNREGNYEQLIILGKKLGFEVEEIPAEVIDGVAVSSTKIRNALAHGNVKLANKLLGYTYSITGVVVEGNKIGRKIGFPTANINVEDKYKLIAAGGVYFCQVDVAGETYHGMGNIGTRPTVNIDGLVTEVHILDFDRDLYGEEITIYFLDRIRDEKKFDTIELLREQLVKDREYILKRTAS
jgi:riboflavin kinase/FMN adenylyltransferase